MANIEIRHLLQINRIPESDITLILFILYLPVGLVLILLRSFILLSLFLITQVLPDTPVSQKLINRIACVGLGISIHVENPKVKDNVHMYISNSLSIFDQIAVCSASGAVSPSCRTTLEKVLGLSTYCFGSITNLDNFKNNIKQFMVEKKTPLYFAPEEKLTNGKALLKFKTYPFEFANKVQPVCIRIERPFLDVAVTTVGSTFVSDMLYFLFVPITNYKLTFLAPLEKSTMSDDEFGEIARQNMATSLKVQVTNYTSNDLAEWEKRTLADPPQRPQTRFASPRTLNPELQRMGKQVKEVLPHVPLTAIYSDLYVTRNVDITITNILEGRVLFTPEQPSATTTSLPSTSSISPSSNVTGASTSGSKTSFNTAASSFSRSASERSRSFQERKEQLIATARRRYIEKHNLDIPI
ncbi:lipid droplet-regulating VLDL assembly factor AUP1-like [Diabrotica undecimpunctata]|uniref:lipid droplet-regulating VLDL assembly factor AUP1-like n=2 Tax=Diabrotica undecimpunctata TaxID=50387 RepID=UPI003B63F2D5